ncbi:MAG: hypothetical protein LBR60_02700, partial [Fibrobacter sp.]|nr:hypothetical protein [Fibrobacter sp.]
MMFGSFAFSAITSTTGADTRKCTASIQVNEDNEVLFAETWDFPGRYGTFSCFETSRSGCIVTPNSDDYRNRFRDFGSRTFKNSKEEICFLNGLGARITYDGCYSGNVAFFDGVRFNKVSCEAPASIPAYCGKSESYARQVILARHQVKCNKLGGTFEGDVFPQEANGETEYCVSGSCEACDSEWRNNLINQWKNSE